MRSRANPVRMGGGAYLGRHITSRDRHLSHQFFSASFCLCSSVSSQSALQSARFCFRVCFFHFWLQKPCNSLTALHLYRHRQQSLRAFWCRMQKLRKATWYKHFSLKSFWTFIGHWLQNTGVCSVFFKCTVNSVCSYIQSPAVSEVINQKPLLVVQCWNFLLACDPQTDFLLHFFPAIRHNMPNQWSIWNIISLVEFSLLIGV